MFRDKKMKNIKYNFIVLLITFAIPFTGLAQWPTDFGSANGTQALGSNTTTKGNVVISEANATDAGTYPIDSNLWVLLLAGCTYRLFKYKSAPKNN